MQNEEEIKQKVGQGVYKILRKKGTERPFSGKYLYEKNKGIYSCVLCGNPLFSSESKFDSGTGWPSFDEALPTALKYKKDYSLDMKRVEIKCAKCDSHLGHVFDDGTTSSGKRYCLNSVCLNLKKEK